MSSAPGATSASVASIVLSSRSVRIPVFRPFLTSSSDRSSSTHMHGVGRPNRSSMYSRPQVRGDRQGAVEHYRPGHQASAGAEGLDFRFDRAVRPNTADAHRLLWWALRSGGAATAWSQRPIDGGVLHGRREHRRPRRSRRPRAAEAGLETDAARRALAEEEGVEALAVALQQAADLGITAVPTFVVNSRWSIPGAQDPDYFVRARGVWRDVDARRLTD